ncbi:MAG: histidine kinase [Devosia nanyangense]|uniref:histidine kinase n=1 Tax=Devosia nanyangense TaxID=1228055 RepID=A0A933L6R3_9HYPH|nr:histidine kinase [Devosia nanyangense]
MAASATPVAATVTASGPDRRPRPIAVYLFVLALVALVPAFAFSAVLLQRNSEAQERVVETLITGSARSIMQTVDREVVANISTLKVLATTESLLNGDLAAFYGRVKTALAGTSTYVYALDANYYSIVSTRGEFGAPPVLSGDIPSARKAFESRDVVVSGLVVGAASGAKVFNVLFPVFEGKLAPLVLGISRDVASLESALLSDKLPDGWNVAMVDSAGTIIAASSAEGNAGKTGEHFALADVATLDSSFRLVTLKADGQLYRAAIRQSLLTGWTLIAWAPASLISQPLVDAVWSLAVGGLLLAAIVVLVVYWVTLQIGRSVRGLEADAKRLGTGQPVTARDYPISEIATVSAAIEEASRRRQQAETEVRFLMRELAHRSKNQMTVIAAMAKQTARGADSVPEFVQAFEKRIFGLARSTDLLLANGVVGVDLRELVTSQIDPFCPADSGRLTLDGPSIRLNTKAAQILGMAAHELATNAVKYGAFQTDSGRLEITWRRDLDVLHFDWRETAQNFTAPSDRRGFGTAVLENMVGRSLGATVERIVHPDGLEWRFEIPASAIDPNRGPEEA